MAKTKGPLLSLGARGSIAKSQVYARWKGVDYARVHVDPANPRTVEQTSTRDVFSSLNAQWKFSPAEAQAPFAAAAQGKPVTDRNVFIQQNLSSMRDVATMESYIGSPGSRGGIPPLSLALASPGAGQINATLVTTAAPTDWTLSEVWGVAFVDRDPHDLPVVFPVVAEDATPTAGGSSVVPFTGLATGTYVVSVWPVWTKPDGFLAYGPSLTDTQVVA